MISKAYQTLVYQLQGVKLMINGCIPVLVTPFKANKEIDYEGLNNLVAYFIDQQVEALWVLGTGSEDMAIPYKKRLDLAVYLSQNFSKKIKLLVGSSFFSFEESVSFIKDLSDLDLHAIHYMPYQPLIGLEQLKRNYLALAELTDFPIWLYTSDNWARKIPPEFLANFATHDGFGGCKYSTANIVSMEKALRYNSANFQVIPAVIKQLVPSLALGAKAATTVEANIHLDRINEIYKAFYSGEIEKSARLQTELNQLMERLSCEAAQQNFLKTAEIKGILEKLGICERWVATGLQDISDYDLEAIFKIYSDENATAQ